MNDEQQTYKEQGCDDEPPGEQIVEESSRERDSNHHEQPSKSMFQQWRDLEIDRRIESGVAVLGLIIGIFVAYVALNQLSAMREQTEAMQNQLAEMKSGSLDTRKLADAAIEQARQLQAGVEETHKLATSTQDSILLAKEQFAINQRPYIWIDQLPIISIKVGEKSRVDVLFTNFGRSPAIRFKHRGQIVFGKDASKKIRPDLFNRIQLSEQRHAGGIIVPGTNREYTTIISDEIVTQSDFNYLKRNVAGWMLLIYMEYFDTNGNLFATEYCRLYLPTGAIAGCGAHNEIR